MRVYLITEAMRDVAEWADWLRGDAELRDLDNLGYGRTPPIHRDV
ncbi:hypothetical protein C8J47_3697 [Sphingomonas sp. PP-F2F-G114-C0414]|nr:hypothetical protein [Sphingomonas sp. PP-F2F-G114-C0414]RMB25747.1 hypothetical protein C8J47_3697 [Sphingomonas sp. PP-F2F-G114-C0414]